MKRIFIEEPERFNVEMDVNVKRMLYEQAKAKNMSMGAYIRELILNKGGN